MRKAWGSTADASAQETSCQAGRCCAMAHCSPPRSAWSICRGSRRVAWSRLRKMSNPNPQTDAELFASVRRELFSAVIGDVMDKMDLRHQFLPPSIQPLAPDMVAVGRAMPVLEADFHDDVVDGSHNPLSAKPFGLMLEALDDLKLHEIYLCTGGSPRYACWGELMSTRAIRCEAAGAVIHGYSRDTRGILALSFPTFSFGRYGQ